MSREENSRQFHEMTKCFERHPKLKTTANAHILNDWAEENGGRELISLEWLELQLSNPALTRRLAVLRTTPDEDINQVMVAKPWLDNIANRQILAQQMEQKNQSVDEAVQALGDRLSFNQELFEEHSAQKQIEERQSLIEEIAAAYSRDEFARDTERKRLNQAGYLTMDQLRAKAQEIADRKRYRGMSAQELKQIVRSTPAVGPALPAEWTKETIRKADGPTLRKLLDRFGDQVNLRLAGR